MQIVTGNLWSELGQSDVVLVSTNSFVRQDGLLVMGRGAAREAATMFPRLRYQLATEIQKRQAEHPKKNPYGIIVLDRNPFKDGDKTTKLGAFQVKRHFSDDASLDLIKVAAQMLHQYMSEHEVSVAMNFPGIGNGRLHEADVLPILWYELQKTRLKVYKK